ncbi:MAG: hypothetical protein QXK06_02940 [Candidatus Diapherotrites archaeon]
MNWQEYNKYRKEKIEWLDFRKIPISTKKSLELLLETIPETARVIEIGAGEKWLEKELAKKRCIYKSMDIDKTFKHDFYSLSSIKGKFDFAVMLSVVEHLSLEEALAYFSKISRLSENLILTTNNPYFPLGFFFDDATHKQPYTPRTLYALLRLSDFKEIEIYRISPSRLNSLKHAISLFTNLDFAPELFVYAKKR